jgi:hypothetical protein
MLLPLLPSVSFCAVAGLVRRERRTWLSLAALLAVIPGYVLAFIAVWMALITPS